MNYVNLVCCSILLFILSDSFAQETSDEYWDALGIASKHYDNAEYVEAAAAFEVVWTKPNEEEMANHRLYAAAANCMIDNEEGVKKNLMKIIPVANKTDVKRVLVNYEIFNKYKHTEWWKELEAGMENRIASLIAHHKNLHIFKKDRNYVYRGIRISKIGDTIVNKRIWLLPQGTGWGDEAADSQSEVVYIYESSIKDSIKHYSEVDSMVGSSFWNAIDTTGVIENSNTFWIHPMRNNEFYKTELAPFPMIKFPVSDSLMNTIKSSTHIMNNWGKYTNTETKEKYNYIGLENRYYANIGELTCHKLKAIGDNSRYGKSYIEYYFHEDHGFTEMNYLTYDEDRIIIKLIDVETN